MTDSTPTTAAVLERFNRAFLDHAPSLLDDLIAPDCVVERTHPTAAGTHLVGREACLANWRALAADRDGQFAVEEMVVLGERGFIFWEYHSDQGERGGRRGLNVMTVRGGLVFEGRGYSKGKGAP